MKRLSLILTTFAILTAGSATAQRQFYRTAYFMEGSTFRSASNPAFRPYRGYVNIPVLGGMNMGLASTSLSVDGLLYPVDGKLVPFYDRNVTWDDLSARLQNNNSFDIDFNTSLLGFGFYTGPSFWSFSLDLRASAGFNLPKDMFRFMKQVSGNYDMANLSAGASAYLSASVGYSRRIFENLTVGGRVNFLGGLARINLAYDKLNVRLNEDVWYIDAQGDFEMAIGNYVPGEEDGNIDFNSLGDIDLGSIKGFAGRGMTFDIGAEYKLMDRITFSASILDMGYMRWNRGITRGVSTTSYTFEGFELKSDGSGGIDTSLDYDFNEIISFEQTSSDSFRSKMRATVILGAELDIFGNNLLGIGLVYMNRRTEFVKRSEFSVSLTLRATDWVTASGSYTFKQPQGTGSDSSNLGLAINFHPRWINFFIGTDFLVSKMNSYLVPISQNRFNIYTGIAIPLGKEKPREMKKLGI